MSEPISLWISGIDFNSFELKNTVASAFITTDNPNRKESREFIDKSVFDLLKKENKRLRDALKLYADEKADVTVQIMIQPNVHDYWEVIDTGETARKALEETK